MATVLLGVSGSIAAYKACDIASRLTQDGHEVLTVLTRSAAEFVSPLTFRTLTGQPVGLDLFAESKGSKVEHIGLARKAAVVVIAPATANLVAKLAQGMADDLLTAAVLATTAPVLIAPAMNAAMWTNSVVQDNVARLRARGFEIIEPGSGMMACGETGPGRMADPADVVAAVRRRLVSSAVWTGRTVLVTAGPTREWIDAVRFVTNPSSGKMGFALALAAKRRGADVTLVTGPVALVDPFGIDVVRVTTGAEMRDAVVSRFDGADALIAAAAVTDYRPRTALPGKTKTGSLEVAMDKVPNILAELAPRKGTRIMVGFAAETGDPEAEGRRKLAERGLDLVAANRVDLPGTGFGADANRVILLYPDGRRDPLPLAPKAEVADRIVAAMEPLLARRGLCSPSPAPSSAL